MIDRQPDPEAANDRDGEQSGLWRWIKIVFVGAAILALLVVVMRVTGGPGGHGPFRHLPSTEAAAPAPAAAVAGSPATPHTAPRLHP